VHWQSVLGGIFLSYIQEYFNPEITHITRVMAMKPIGDYNSLCITKITLNYSTDQKI